MVEVVPSILTSNIGELREMIARCEGVVDRVHIDIIDGEFAHNKTVDPNALFELDTTLLLDFHLMVKEPKSWVERCVRGSADRIIGQIEMMTSQEEFVRKVESVGKYVGLAIDVKTQVAVLDDLIINNLDAVLVMSVSAGFGGQEFDPSALPKIEKLDEIRSRDTSPFNIIDDGGITLDTVDDSKRAGVDEVVVGRRLFDGDLKTNIEKFIKASYGKVE